MTFHRDFVCVVTENINEDFENFTQTFPDGSNVLVAHAEVEEVDCPVSILTPGRNVAESASWILQRLRNPFYETGEVSEFTPSTGFFPFFFFFNRYKKIAIYQLPLRLWPELLERNLKRAPTGRMISF